MAGLIHIYCGNGKGKTTSATGLAIRALGAGKQVIFAQFLKDGTSSEINILKGLNGINTYAVSTNRGFYSRQNDEERNMTKKEMEKLFNEVIKRAENGVQLLVLDEIISAVNYGIIDEKKLIEFLENRPPELEVVMTGRNPSQNLLKIADYVTEMRKIKHPYDEGIVARRGIEF